MPKDSPDKDPPDETPLAKVQREGKVARQWLVFWGALFGQQFALNSITDVLRVGEVFWSSIPLIVALAVLYVAFAKGALGPNMPGIIGSVVILTVATVLGNAAGLHKIAWPGSEYGSTPPGLLVGLLASYLTGYGLFLFGTSIILGVFLGRAYRTLVAA